MIRERELKVALVLVGLLFSAGIYPVVTSVRDGWQPISEDALPMMLSLYLTMGSSCCWQRATHPPIAASSLSEHGRVFAHAAVGRHGRAPSERTRRPGGRGGRLWCHCSSSGWLAPAKQS
jgi:hypothetical protein